MICRLLELEQRLGFLMSEAVENDGSVTFVIQPSGSFASDVGSKHIVVRDEAGSPSYEIDGYGKIGADGRSGRVLIRETYENDNYSSYYGAISHKVYKIIWIGDIQTSGNLITCTLKLILDHVYSGTNVAERGQRSYSSEEVFKITALK